MAVSKTKLDEWHPSASPRNRLKHQALRHQLLGEIAIGRFRPGDLLPGEHQLAEMMRVSRTTVRQTLGELEREGFVRRVQGKGTFVSERTNQESTPRTAALGLVVPDVSTGYYPTLVSGFERFANEAGRPIVVCNTYNEVDKQASQLMRLIDQRVAGILLNPSSNTVTPSYQVRLVQDAGIPVVLLHRGIPEVLAPVLEIPSQEVGSRAAKLMLDAGHRRVAFLASHRSASSELMEKGFREALAAAGADLPPEWADYGSMQAFTPADYESYEHYLQDLLGRWVQQSNRPTAVFLTFDATAEIAYLIAGRLGLKVPDDLSIVCFGGAQRDGAVMRRLTTLTIDEAEAARQAIELLKEMQSGRLPIRSSSTTALNLGLSKGNTLSQL